MSTDDPTERAQAPYIYVASSWRNPIQPDVVAALWKAGNGVYDFRNPEGGTGFAWSSIDPDWQAWTAREYIAALDHPLAVKGFTSDFDAMQRADVFVLVLPCGRSAHLELGWAVGAGKRTAILTRDGEEPELMAKMVDLVTDDLDEIVAWAAEQSAGDCGCGHPAAFHTPECYDVCGCVGFHLAQQRPDVAERETRRADAAERDLAHVVGRAQHHLDRADAAEAQVEQLTETLHQANNATTRQINRA